jgi:hypothetical protein
MTEIRHPFSGTRQKRIFSSVFTSLPDLSQYFYFLYLTELQFNKHFYAFTMYWVPTKYFHMHLLLIQVKKRKTKQVK